ncbi:hypothetical protein [Citrobacter rodentium]|uniref:Uncharacterized protein n=2 Tax=Citrobacter rodentium TaxID=67825 RepID=D2TQX2_CITRI|nr:hypothetical protein [Citrobacter rodentium]KIQ49818.1 hypothetical protein TA05_18885 [Citrobacter rodentium]QBY29908.1 hypothetical protein E2R62_14360 [Citrobacter rodentium]UHO32703.1 hypothetical protein K7R23_08710 [Citrobacter rodentium NBRC 105723 = DSM 16636]CBG90262.1 conserved hypothetical protein [Citrobacter rodentium ICC168]HAT8014252.1 hypothetical protein [Citrobacter rodentium NBRC 105723 = DSM 16636]
MLPEHLVPAHFHLLSSGSTNKTAENPDNLTQGKKTLSDYEADILISATHTGQAKNMLLEEHDRHFKERLYRVAKIETFARLINSLQAEGDIDAQALSKIIAEATTHINENGNEIWLNLITRETSAPLFYSLEAENE